MISSLLAGTSYLCWPSGPWNHKLGLRAGGSGEYGEKGQRRTLEEGGSERLGTEQKDGKGHYGGREIKAWKRRSSPRLRQIWKIIVLVGLKKQAKESVFTGGSSSAQLRLQQDPEPLLLLHQQIPLNMFKPLNGVVMNRPYRNADLHLHPKVWTRHSKEACSSNLSREKANDWADTR